MPSLFLYFIELFGLKWLVPLMLCYFIFYVKFECYFIEHKHRSENKQEGENAAEKKSEFNIENFEIDKKIIELHRREKFVMKMGEILLIFVSLIHNLTSLCFYIQFMKIIPSDTTIVVNKKEIKLSSSTL